MNKTQRDEIEAALKQAEAFVKEVKGSVGLPIVPDAKTGAATWYDQRELRLKYTVSVEKTRRFFEGLADGRIMATRCRRCGELYFPPQDFCSRCGSEDVEWIELSDVGQLLTFTVINVKPMSFSHYQDYTVGIARMPEGINVLAWVDGDPKKLRVGMKVKLKVVRRQPENYLIYEFEPVE